MESIRLGIVGYGNLGKGVQKAIRNNKDMQLQAIFTRRRELVNSYESNPDDVYAPMVLVDELKNWKKYIDVIILCGGSATDLPVQGPEIAGTFNTVDSFDTHADIPTYFEEMNDKACEGKKISIISAGWDPGMFSIERVISDAILPGGNYYTFWGKGVSQGHSDAIRRISGVKNAVQYTIPIKEAMERVEKEGNPKLTTREKHTRECFVVAKEGADKAKIETEIKEMPKYFADYNTTVHFITEEELIKNHSTIPHGGNVIYTAMTGDRNKHIINYSLKLQSNPEFTGSVLIAYARAAYRLNKKGEYGAKTVLDISPKLLSSKNKEELLKMV